MQIKDHCNYYDDIMLSEYQTLVADYSTGKPI